MHILLQLIHTTLATTLASASAIEVPETRLDNEDIRNIDDDDDDEPTATNTDAIKTKTSDTIDEEVDDDEVGGGGGADNDGMLLIGPWFEEQLNDRLPPPPLDPITPHTAQQQPKSASLELESRNQSQETVGYPHFIISFMFIPFTLIIHLKTKVCDTFPRHSPAA